ncbi:MAG: hypothetical protein IKE01_03595 [Clostridia bacterium]|nr:hypothetical protein [Clostridia bacterium]
MKKFLKVVIIIIIFALLGIDFWGLWKYKLNGTTYELDTSSDDVAMNEISDSDGGTEYGELDSSMMKNGERLFIKNIGQSDDGKYEIKGLIYNQYEITKADYNSLRDGNTVEVLGKKYKKYQIKSNNLVIKSSEEGAQDLYVKYDTEIKKYVVKEAKTDNEIYQSSNKYVKLTVNKGTEFSTEKNGNTQKKKIEDVADSHKDVQSPDGSSDSVNLCSLTFDKNGNCTKIVEHSK